MLENFEHASILVLGSGTSVGVPMIGCRCKVCTSSDARDKRLRPSILLRFGDQRVLIDTTPDFRYQALRFKIDRLDAILFTHSHADHILGLDDLRPLSFIAARESGPIPLYATPETRAVLEHVFDYTFSPSATYANRARVRLHPVLDRNPVHGVDFVPIPLFHGKMPIIGYRFGRAAYLTDVSDIPEPSFPLLQDLDLLVLSALRHKPHPSHATVDQAVGWSRRIGAKQTWLTHIAHELGHEATNQLLPPGIAMAYDGLSLDVTL